MTNNFDAISNFERPSPYLVVLTLIPSGNFISFDHKGEFMKYLLLAFVMVGSGCTEKGNEFVGLWSREADHLYPASIEITKEGSKFKIVRNFGGSSMTFVGNIKDGELVYETGTPSIPTSKINYLKSSDRIATEGYEYKKSKK